MDRAAAACTRPPFSGTVSPSPVVACGHTLLTQPVFLGTCSLQQCGCVLVLCHMSVSCVLCHMSMSCVLCYMSVSCVICLCPVSYVICLCRGLVSYVFVSYVFVLCLGRVSYVFVLCHMSLCHTSLCHMSLSCVLCLNLHKCECLFCFCLLSWSCVLCRVCGFSSVWVSVLNLCLCLCLLGPVSGV